MRVPLWWDRQAKGRVPGQRCPRRRGAFRQGPFGDQGRPDLLDEDPRVEAVGIPHLQVPGRGGQSPDVVLRQTKL